MRNLNELNKYRITGPRVRRIYGSDGDGKAGAFKVLSPIDNKELLVIASVSEHWDHVSISRPKRTPAWRELEYIKRMFFKDDETAMQLHVPTTEHINCASTCLHLWRPTFASIPRPPAVFVGPKNESAVS